MSAEHIGRPLVERRAVEPDLAAKRLPDADQCPHQRRLPRCARPDHAQPMAGLELEGDVLHRHLLVARRHDAHPFDRQTARRSLQQHLRRPWRQLFEQAVEPMPALPRGDEALPVRDREIDRRQRPRAEDGAGDDDAGGRLLVDHQVGADAEHRRLQHHAQHLGDRAKSSRDVAGVLVAQQIILVGLAPAPGQAPRHAHRDQHFGIAPAGRGEIVAARRQAHRIARRCPRHVLGDHGETDQDDRADQRGEPDHDMEGKADRQIERQPWQVEERAGAHAGKERADVVQIAQRLQPVIAAADEQRQANHGFEHPVVEGLIERGADPTEDPGADHVEDALHDVHAARQDREADQGRHAAARQHPVIDLQHEQRAGQVEQVDHAAHDANADEGIAAGAQRITEFGTPDGGNRRHQS